jgi:hypothetical protein
MSWCIEGVTGERKEGRKEGRGCGRGGGEKEGKGVREG